MLSAHANFCRLLPLSCHAQLRKFKLISDVSAVAAPGSVWVLQFLDPPEGPSAETPQAKHGLTEEEARKALTENGDLPKAKLCVSLVSLYLHIVYKYVYILKIISSLVVHVVCFLFCRQYEPSRAKMSKHDLYTYNIYIYDPRANFHYKT